MSRRPDGALEQDVLHVLWSADGPLLPSEITARLDAPYAYTSIATVLSRLHRKGLVSRSPSGRAFVYESSVSEPELAVRRISKLLDAASNRNQVLASFFDTLTPRELNAVKSMLLDHPQRDEPS